MGIHRSLSLRYGAQQEMKLQILLIGIEFYTFFFSFFFFFYYSLASQSWEPLCGPGL
jgi:hypothetical protein